MNISQPTAYSPFQKTRQNLDYPLLAAVTALSIAGVVFVFTSSAAHSWQATNGQSVTYLINHLQRLSVGAGALVLFYHVRYQFLSKISKSALALCLAALVAVLFTPQIEGTTARRWFIFFGLSVQPAEIAKYALIVYAARRLSEIDASSFPHERKRKFNSLLIVSSVVLGLIVIEPNLSMVLLTAGSVFVMFFLHGLEWKKIGIIGLVGVIALSGVVMMKPYMLVRIDSFLSGISDPMSTSYHVRQSLITIGQGGFWGLGLGQSTQKHYYLPEPYNDSIFSIIGEEAGFVGASIVVALFTVLAYRGWKIAVNARDEFSYYLAAGITASLIGSCVLNVGVNLALLPATGQPLPFVSYGGSSLLMSLGAVGVLLNIAKQQNSAARWQGSPRRVERV